MYKLSILAIINALFLYNLKLWSYKSYKKSYRKNHHLFAKYNSKLLYYLYLIETRPFNAAANLNTLIAIKVRKSSTISPLYTLLAKLPRQLTPFTLNNCFQASFIQRPLRPCSRQRDRKDPQWLIFKINWLEQRNLPSPMGVEVMSKGRKRARV